VRKRAGSLRRLVLRCQKLTIDRSFRALALVGVAAAAFVNMGCRQDMHDQPRYKTLGYTNFFQDGRESRPIPPNAVALGYLDQNEAFYQGKEVGVDIDYFPIPVTAELIERGHVRFDIYCSPCHGRVGNGLGMIVRRGLKQPPSYHIERLRNAPVGHFYDVITNGYGAMLNYAAQIQPRDRWAIISYIRALQYSQNATVAELPADIQAKLPAVGSAPNASPQVPANPDVVNPNQPNIPTNKPVPTANPGAE
jgi:mono/diheme cytochrome c family protein